MRVHLPLALLLPALVWSSQGYWLRARGTPYCADPNGLLNVIGIGVLTFTCDFSSNQMQWGFDFWNKAIFWAKDSTKCIIGTNINSDGLGVYLGSCTAPARFFFGTTGGAQLQGTGLTECLNPQSTLVVTQTCNSANPDQEFDFLLGSPGNSEDQMLVGKGCYQGGGALLSASGTAASCALAASRKGFPYFAMYGTGDCHGWNAMPTTRAAPCGQCANAPGEICGGANSARTFVYQTPTCSPGCVACYSAGSCAQCGSGFLLVNNQCLPQGTRVCLVGGAALGLTLFQSTTECWNPSTRTWDLDPALSLPVPLTKMTSFTRPSDGVLCLAGGILESGAHSNGVYCLNSSAPWHGGDPPKWVPFTPLPNNRALMSTVYLSGGVPVLVGGSIDGVYTNTALVLSGTTWTPTPSLSTGFARAGSNAVYNNGQWCIWAGLSPTSMVSGECLKTSGTPSWSTQLSFLLYPVGDAILLDYGAGDVCIGGGTQQLVVQCQNLFVWSVSFALTLGAFGNQNHFKIDGYSCYSSLQQVSCWVSGNWMSYPALNYYRDHFGVITYDMVAPPYVPDVTTLGVDYALGVVSSRWSSFFLNPFPVPSSNTTWQFPSARSSTALGSTIIQFPPFAFSPSPTPHPFSATLYTIWSAPLSANLSFTASWAPLLITIYGGNKDVGANSTVQLTVVVVDETSTAILNANAVGGTPAGYPSPPPLVQFSYTWDVSGCASQTTTIGNSITTGTVALSNNLTLQTNLVNQDVSCPLSVTVTDSLGRSVVAASVQLNVRKNIQFTVAISATSSALAGPVPVLIKVPSTSTLRLLCTASPIPPTLQSALLPADMAYHWTITPTLNSSCNLGINLIGRAVVIPANCLSQNTSYMILVNGTHSSNVTASAWLSIHTDSRPTGGTCDVSTVAGEALVSRFLVKCSKWTSPSGSALTYALKRIDNTVQPPFRLALSLRQTLPVFQDILLPLLGSTTATQGSVNLVVEVWADSGDLALVTLPTVVVNATTTLLTGPLCPLPMAVDTIQGLIVIVGSFSPPLKTVVGCDSATRQAAWNRLWAWVQDVVLNSHLDDNSLEYVSGAIEALMGAAFPSSGTTITSPIPPHDFETGLTTVLETLLTTPLLTANTTGAVVRAVVTAIPALQGLNTTLGCTTLDNVLHDIAAIVQRASATNLPGEPAYQITTELSSFSSQSFFGGAGAVSSASLSTSDGSLLDISIPTSLLSLGGDVSQIHISDYSTTISACRPTQGDLQLVGPIVDITLSSQYKVIAASSIDGGFTFTMPVSSSNGKQTELCGTLSCVWWNSTARTWSSEGCTALHQSSASSVQCTCTHLTEFSLLMQPGCVTAEYKALYYTLLGAYCLIALVTAGKLIYRISARMDESYEKASVVTSLVFQHSLIFMLAISRVAVCAALASQNRQNWSMAARAVVLVLPYLLMFWIYTLMVFQWGSLYHWGMQSQGQAFSRVKGVFIASNLGLTAAIVAMIVIMAGIKDPTSTSSDREGTLVIQAAGGVIAGVTLITALSFLVYAFLLYRTLEASASTRKQNEYSARNLVTNESEPTKSRCCCAFPLQVHHKIMWGATIVCSLLCLEAVLHVVSMAIEFRNTKDAADATEVVALVADILCLFTLLAMYHRAICVEGRKKIPTKQSSNNNNLELSAKSGMVSPKSVLSISQSQSQS